jgi:Zn-dependent protease with chaperone function
MLNEFPGVSLLLAAIAIAPGLGYWWRSRTLMGLTDDAALPERLLAARTRNNTALGAALVLLVVISIQALVWTLPLLFFASALAAYPLRKALFGDTWGPATYVWFIVRVFVAVWGFWIALALSPLIVSYASSSLGVYAALAVALTLAAWNIWYADILRFLLRARPIEDPALLGRFHAMVAVSGIPMPRFERVDLQGGAIANAIALPSLGGSSVIFTDTLLARLPTDETVAICAHELAHHEHFTPAYLKRMRVVDLLLIASAAAVMPVSSWLGGSSSLFPLLLWALALLASMVWRVRDRQRHETDSDLRAVALCGNAEALVSGLTRLYTMARVPRRLESTYEQHATHPSLARRIRDIRSAAGTAAATLDAPANFTATDGGAVVTFDAEKLHWHEGDAATHTLSYAHLRELRLDVRGAQQASLVVLERSGRRWEARLAAEDVVRAQAVLDVVDARLPQPAGPAMPAVPWPKINRIVLAVVAMIGLSVGQIAVAFVTFLALLQPASPLIAAAGIASLGAACVLVLRGSFFDAGIAADIAFCLAVLGVGLLYLARKGRGEPVPRRAAIAAVFLGSAAALSVGLLAMGGINPVRLHQSARSATDTPVLLVAFAAALALWRSRTARYAAVPVVMVAAATSVAASSAFLDRFGDDPFLAQAEPVAWRIISGGAASEFTVPFIASAIRLSPSGSRVAVVTGEPDEGDAVTFHVGRPGTLTPVDAAELIFLDDENVLTLEPDGNGVELRQLRADAPKEAGWRVRVPDVSTATLTRGARRWRVMGWSRDRHIVRAEGEIGAETVQRTEWPPVAAAEGWVKSMAASGDDLLLVESRLSGFPSNFGLWRWAWLFQADSETHFRAARAGEPVADVASSQMDAQCFAGALDGDALACGAFDGTRTRFVAIDPVARRLSGVAWVEGRFYPLGTATGPWLTGWRDCAAAALNLARRQAIQVGACGADRVFRVSASDRVVAALSYNGTGTTIRLYPLN